MCEKSFSKISELNFLSWISHYLAIAQKMVSTENKHVYVMGISL